MAGIYTIGGGEIIYGVLNAVSLLLNGGSAVNEAVNGNFNYGNVNLGNSQMGNVSNLQRNMNSLIGSGGHRLDTGGVQITNDAKGFSVMNRMQDTGIANLRGSLSSVVAAHKRVSEAHSHVNSVNARLAEGKSMLDAINTRQYEQVSQLKSDDMVRNYGIGSQDAQNVVEYAKYMDSKTKGKSYNSGTSAQGNLGLGGVLSGSLGFSKTKMGDTGTEKAAETLRGLQVSASINGGVSTGVNASNARIYGSQAQIDEAQTYNYHKSRVESAMKSLGTSERNDELTSIARDYNKNIQEMDSLSKAMEINQSRIIQAEKNVQESIHTTISLDDNLLDDFIVGAKKVNPEMSDNQAKELFFRGDRNSEEYKEAVHYVQAINRPTQSKLEKP